MSLNALATPDTNPVGLSNKLNDPNTSGADNSVSDTTCALSAETIASGADLIS